MSTTLSSSKEGVLDFKEADEPRPHAGAHHDGVVTSDEVMIDRSVNRLQRGLSGFHTSMIAIGGAIGAGLFVSAGGAFALGGPAAVFIGFVIISIMMWMVMQALGELACLYPENGAFNVWFVRFIDPSWGFAMANLYAISWLTVLPFELTAAGLTISYWHPHVNVGVWIAVFLVALMIVQFFGVRAYGWTEVVLSAIKCTALIGFCLFAIIDNCGGVPTDPRGYIGGRYWQNGLAFHNGFHGFCAVFVTAAFSFGGTELVGLTAAENRDPVKQLPKAIRQSIWRIVLFYIVSLLLVGLLVPSDNPHLLDASSTDTRYSIFVIALDLARVKGLPSVLNVVITLSVLSVANSATYGSTRTYQALAGLGMYPRWMAYVDKKGRPLPAIILQVLFAMLAFINEATTGQVIFNWLLSLTAVAYFFIWASICLAHIRFRMAWKYRGHSIDELPYRASFGVAGSYLGIFLNLIAFMASVYYGAAPFGPQTQPLVETWFSVCIAVPLLVALYLFWKIFSWFKFPEHRPLYIKIKDIDVYRGMREGQFKTSGEDVTQEDRRASVGEIQAMRKHTMMDRVKIVLTSCF